MLRNAYLQKQLVIETEDRMGLLAEISRLLSDMGINILVLVLQVKNSSATFHLITNSQLYARDALRDAGFQVEEREVVVLELPNRPGELCQITAALARKEIEIFELYTTVAEGSSQEMVVLTCSNNSKTVLMLRGH